MRVLRIFLLFVIAGAAFGAFFFVMPRLAQELQRVWIERALQKRFGTQFRYESIIKTEKGWKLNHVQMDTAIADVFCPECLVDTHLFSISLEDITAQALVTWKGNSFPPCRLILQQGQGVLIEEHSGKKLLAWDPFFYHLKELPCPLSVSLLTLFTSHHPLEGWTIEAGTISGSLKRVPKGARQKNQEDSWLDASFQTMDLFVQNIQLHLAGTPLRFTLKEGSWHSTPDRLCTGSASILCRLATSPERLLEIPAENWNLSLQHQTAFVTLHSNLQALASFFGLTEDFSGPLLLEMQLPLDGHHASGSLHVADLGSQLPFFVEFNANKPCKAVLEGYQLPLGPFFASLVPLPQQATLHGMMDLKAELNYPDWHVTAELLDASLETPDFSVYIDACQGPVQLKGDVYNGLDELTADITRAHGVHPTSHLIAEALSGHLQADKEKIAVHQIDGYINGMWVAGNLLYDPNVPDSVFKLHVSNASGKISTLQPWLRQFREFRFLANMPCDGSIVLSQEGATLLWNEEASLCRCQLTGSLLDLRLTGDTSMTAQDLSCGWRYDSLDHAFALHDLHGTLEVLHEEARETYLVQSDLLCGFNGSQPKMDLDLCVGTFEHPMLRLVGELDWIQKEKMQLRFCPLQSCFGTAHPERFCIGLEEDGSLSSLDLSITLVLEDSLDVLKRISRIPYCTVEPLFMQWLTRLTTLKGLSHLACNYDKRLSTLCCCFQADRLQIEGRSFHNCLIEGSIHPQQWQINQLRLGEWQLAALLEKSGEEWKIPFLALQYEDALLAGFEGLFNRQTRTLEGQIPLLTLRLQEGDLWKEEFIWKGKGSLACHMPLQEEPTFNLCLSGACDKQVMLSLLKSAIPPLDLQLQGSRKQLSASVKPQGLSLAWPLRPCHLRVTEEEEGYTLHGQLEDSLHPLWMESNPFKSFSDPLIARIYDALPPQERCLLIQPLVASPQDFSLKGHLWGCEVDLFTKKEASLVQGTVSWSTLQTDKDFKFPWPMPLDRMPLQAAWHIQGKWNVPYLSPELSYQGKISASRGYLEGQALPAWSAELAWQPAKCELSNMKVDDPHLSCTLEKLEIQGGIEGSFTLKNLRMNEKSFSTHDLERVKFPWHPHMVVSSIEIPALQGRFFSPYDWTGNGKLQFHRPSNQRRLGKEDPVRQFFPLPDLLTPIQGTIYGSVQNGVWEIAPQSQAYSEGKLVEFLLAANRPATISETGQLDITVQARPAKHRFHSTKRQIFHLQGPFWQPSCNLEN